MTTYTNNRNNSNSRPVTIHDYVYHVKEFIGKKHSQAEFDRLLNERIGGVKHSYWAHGKDAQNQTVQSAFSVYKNAVEGLNRGIQSYFPALKLYPAHTTFESFKVAYGLKSLLMVGGAMVATWAASQFATKDHSA